MRRALGPLLVALPALALVVLPLVLFIATAPAGMHEAWGTPGEAARSLRLLVRTVLLAAGTGLGALALGLPAGLLLSRTDLPGRAVAAVLGLVPLALPPYMHAIAWIDLMGRRGLVNRLIGALGGSQEAAVSIFGNPAARNPSEALFPSGAVWILTLALWPIAAGIVAAAAGLVDSQQEDAARLEGGERAAVLRVILPMVAPAALLALVLVALLCLAEFGVPGLLNVPVYPEQIYVDFGLSYRPELAAAHSLPLLAIGGLALAAVLAAVRGLPQNVQTEEFAGRRVIRLGRWRGPAAAFVTVLLLLSVGAPVADIAWWAGGGSHYRTALVAGSEQLFSSLRFSAVATVGAVVLAVLVLGAGRRGGRGPATPPYRETGLATGPTGRIPSPPAPLLQERGAGPPRASGGAAWLPVWLLLLPAALPGSVLAIGFIRAGRVAGIGNGGVLLAGCLTAVVLPAALVSLWAVLRSANPELEECAALDGASALRRWVSVVLPPARPGLLAGAGAAFVLAMRELPATILLYPPGRETAAAMIFSQMHYGFIGDVAAMCILTTLLTVGVVALGAVVGLGRWRPHPPPAWLGRGSGALLGLLMLLLAGCRPEGAKKPADGIPAYVRAIIGGRGEEPGRFYQPRKCTLGLDGDLYVVDSTARVQRFHPDGTFVLEWLMPERQKGKPEGLSVDLDGSVLIADTHYSRLLRYTPDGKRLAVWGGYGSGPGQFIYPMGVDVDRKGCIYVCEYGDRDRVQVFSPEGRFLRAWGGHGGKSGEFRRASGLALDRRGDVYVADACNHRIQRFTAEGEYVLSWGHPGTGPGELKYPYDVAIAAEGDQEFAYVVEYGNHRVQKLTLDGRPVGLWGPRPGDRPGELSGPWGLAVDARGLMYVADTGNHRVQVWDSRER